MNSLRNKILVAVDFEEHSMNAFQQACQLARICNAEILSLYVIEPLDNLYKHIAIEDYINKMVLQAREKFDELVKQDNQKDKKCKIPVANLILKGKPYEKILEVANDYGVLMIVMGKTGIDTFRKSKYIGSNTYNVIREAKCPVVSMDNKSNVGKLKNLLIPVDLEKNYENQLDTAASFASNFASALNIFTVFNVKNVVDRIIKLSNNNKLRKRLKKKNVNFNIDAIRLQKSHSISKYILSKSEQVNADMIIISTQQKKDIVNCFIGSTAQKIINKSKIPVLSIMPDAKLRLCPDNNQGKLENDKEN